MLSSSTSSLTPGTAASPRRVHRSARGGERRRPPKCPRISISINPSDVDPLHLRDLLLSCNLSPHRFPSVSPDGLVGPAAVEKLRTAVANSSVVVSAFCREKHRDGVGETGFEQLLERALPLPPEERRLVGFGRAVCDGGLTASIHDVVVIPSLQRLGIGRKIIMIITRLFFEACGFGNDYLGATTMMYTRSGLAGRENNSMVKTAGRIKLAVPSSPIDFI